MKLIQGSLFQKRKCLLLPAYLLLLNLPLVLMAHRLALLPPGYINLEYLLIGTLGVFLPRSFLFAMLFLDSLADFILSISLTYMLSVRDMFASLGSLASLPSFRILEILVVFAVVVVTCAAAAHARPRPEDRLKVVGCLLIILAIVASSARLLGQDPFKRDNSDVIYPHLRLLRAPILPLARLNIYYHRVTFLSHIPNSDSMNSASSHASAFLQRPGAVMSPNVVVVIVESWGQPLDAQLDQALYEPFVDPRVTDNYDVSKGSVAFNGTTVPAEARELCNSKMGFNILLASPDLLHGCLPAVLHDRHYESISIHGYSGSLFQRKMWYPKVGFDQSWFGPDLDKLNLPRCGGAFSGTCDADIAGWIESSILSVDTGSPRFIYWVTLNSHLPLPARPNLPDDGVCSALLLLRDSVSLCSWFRLVRNVHLSIQKVALAPPARPTVFILVGDHAPPFSDPELRQNFSATDVPYILLTPKRVLSR